MNQKFDLYILDEADLAAIRLWEQVKEYTQKTDKCGISCSINSKYPNIAKSLIQIMLKNGLSLEETTVIAEEIKDKSELEQMTVLMQRI